MFGTLKWVPKRLQGLSSWIPGIAWTSTKGIEQLWFLDVSCGISLTATHLYFDLQICPSGEVEYQLSDAIFNQKLGTNRIFVLFLGQLHFLAVKSLHGNTPFMHMDINPTCCKHMSYIYIYLLQHFATIYFCSFYCVDCDRIVRHSIFRWATLNVVVVPFRAISVLKCGCWFQSFEGEWNLLKYLSLVEIPSHDHAMQYKCIVDKRSVINSTYCLNVFSCFAGRLICVWD